MRFYIIYFKQDHYQKIIRNKIEVVFPTEKVIPFYKGISIGAGDFTGNILFPFKEDNWKNEGIVFYRDSKFLSMNGLLYQYIPKKGAVIIGKNIKGFGHIETICAAKGVLCIIAEEQLLNSTIDLVHYIHQTWLKQGNIDNPFKVPKFSKIRVVGNGLEGRVYGIK